MIVVRWEMISIGPFHYHFRSPDLPGLIFVGGLGGDIGGRGHFVAALHNSRSVRFTMQKDCYDACIVGDPGTGGAL